MGDSRRNLLINLKSCRVFQLLRVHNCKDKLKTGFLHKEGVFCRIFSVRKISKLYLFILQVKNLQIISQKIILSKLFQKRMFKYQKIIYVRLVENFLLLRLYFQSFLMLKRFMYIIVFRPFVLDCNLPSTSKACCYTPVYLTAPSYYATGPFAGNLKKQSI